MKHLLHTTLMMVAFFVATTSLSAQTLMRVHLHDGSLMSALVANIDSVTWVATDIGQNDEGETSVTGIATNITKNSATITAFANGILDNLATDIRIGIIYTSNGTPTRSNGTIVDVNANTIATDGSYSIALNGLIPETTYYYRSFVYQSGIWFYGNTRSFTTSGSGELFTTGAASSVTCFSASVAASVNVDSSSPYTSMTYGICYGTSIDPTMDNQHTVATNRDSSTGEFTTVLRGLYGGTTYYYRPYAVIDGVTKYGQSSQFKTLDDNVVETVEVNIEAGTATAHLMLGGGDYSNIKLGFCYSKNENPIYSKGSATTDEVNDEHLFTVLLPPLYDYKYYRSFVLIDGTPHYGNIINTSSISIQESEAVDLGLSVKWAPMNVGAAQPSDSGLYFAWGETEAKTTYDWSTYKYCEGSSNSITKYCTNSTYGTVDGKTSLELPDDAANVNWGGNWRMPTIYELNELKNYCTWSMATVNNVAGYYVTGKNGNRIFIANGSYLSNTLSNDLDSGSSSLAVSYNPVSYNQVYLYYPSRSADESVRPVTDY